MKRMIAFLLCALLALGSLADAFAAETGSEALPGDVAENSALGEAVLALIEAGAVTGDTDGLFHPEQNLTRAQLSKMLVSLMKPEAGELGAALEKVLFRDVVPERALSEEEKAAGKKQHWACEYIYFMALKGIAKGYAVPDTGDGRPAYEFRPDGNVTLAELETFTERASGKEESEKNWTASRLATKEDAALLLYSELLKKDASSGGENGAPENDSSATPASGGNDTTRPSESVTSPGRVVRVIDMDSTTGKFSGRAYAVINEAEHVSVEENDDVNAELHTLSAGLVKSWYALKSSGALSIDEDEMKNGTLYELDIKSDEVRGLAKAGDAGVKGSYFKEITTAAGGSQWWTVTDVDSDRAVVKAEDAAGNDKGWIIISEDAFVYRLDTEDEDDAYSLSGKNAIRKGNRIRLYQYLKHEDETEADVVIVQK